MINTEVMNDIRAGVWMVYEYIRVAVDRVMVYLQGYLKEPFHIFFRNWENLKKMLRMIFTKYTDEK